MKLLILAAGYATRLYPLTLNQPKPLLEVAGKPMINHVIEKFAACPEIDEIAIVTNDKFTSHFEKWAAQSAGVCGSRRVRVFNDGTRSDADKLGAIGDIRFVIQKAGIDDDLIVVAGDNLFSDPLDGYVKDAREKGILLGVYDVGSLEEIKKYGNVAVDASGRLTHFEEKPKNPRSTLAALALYHYPRQTLPLIGEYVRAGNHPDQPGRLIQWLYPNHPVFAHRVGGLWLDIGSKETLQEANKVFANLKKS
ncbi:MAG: nucleotidyltransferase family protein [Verrucomicrobiae bacterium]|nr:nucleotidyltransferase family protein [Verrucomicrobiae bacterium]